MWPNPQETADFVTFTAGILNGKLHFLCSEWFYPEPWNDSIIHIVNEELGKYIENVLLRVHFQSQFQYMDIDWFMTRNGSLTCIFNIEIFT